MEYLKLLGYLLLLVIIFIWVGSPEINFKPFSFRLVSWRISMFWVFLMISLFFYASEYERIGKKKGWKAGADFAISIFEEKLEEKRNSNK